ncbi:unnamed protein product [Lactuca saligna]|uniref:Uncharacterized protein n=1 Tax=Lactuca saligna TaxID=75948 RepID=A0AA35UZN5_LACSI|nr:unnamed protein product [Lactuca saligna]
MGQVSQGGDKGFGGVGSSKDPEKGVVVGKVLKKNYGIDNSDFNQFDFLINHKLFTSSQFKIVENFNDIDEFKRPNIRFHAVLGKNEEDICSPMKIMKMMTIICDKLFEGLLENFLYVVLKANNATFEFTIADFLLMKLNDLIMFTNILSNVDVSKIIENNKDDLIISFAHIKFFIDNYYDFLEITDIELALTIKKPLKSPQSFLRGKININDYEPCEIIHQPLGVVFQGKN